MATFHLINNRLQSDNNTLLTPLCNCLRINSIRRYIVFNRAQKARLGKNNAACLVGAFIGVLIWVVFVHSIFSNSTNLIHLALFLAGATPIAALPALIFYGPGKK